MWKLIECLKFSLPLLINKWTVSKWKKYIQQWHKFVYYQQQLRRPIVNVYKIDEKQNIKRMFGCTVSNRGLEIMLMINTMQILS